MRKPFSSAIMLRQLLVIWLRKMDDDLDYREKIVLNALETRGLLRYCELPPGVGYKTMDRLVKRGIVRAVDLPRAKRQPRNLAWERVK